jgi:hypothetical protein
MLCIEKSLVILTLCVAVAAAGCSSSGQGYTVSGVDMSKYDKVAVVDVQTNLGPAAGNQMATYFEIELIKRGYSPIERKQISVVMAEQGFQTGGATSAEDAVTVGRVLNVPAVMVVNVPEWGQKVRMTAKLIEVETARILWIGDGQGSTGRTAATVLGALAGAGLGAAVGGGDTSDKVAGAVVGGAVGGGAGYLLSPSDEKIARQVIQKVCASLPPR